MVRNDRVTQAIRSRPHCLQTVTGLLVGEDLSRVLGEQPTGHRYLLPDVCLSGGRFLDGTIPADLPRPVEVVATDGSALRRAVTTGRGSVV